MNAPPLLLLPWRAALLWLLSVAPWAAPVEARLGADPRPYAAAGLLFFALIAAFVVRRFEVRGRRDAVAVWLVALCLLSFALALVLPRHTFPLAMGTLLVAPALWGALLVAIRQRTPSSNAPLFFALCVAVISWLLGASRLSTRERIWQETLAINPRWSVAHHALLELAVARGADAREQDAIAERCFTVLLGDQRCASLAVLARSREGDCVRALEAARVALRGSVEPSVLAASARCVDSLRKSDDESLTIVRRASEVLPRDEQLRRALANTLERRGDRDGALAVLRQGGEWQSAEVQLSIARLSIERGDEATARRVIDAVIERDPTHAEARFMRGWLEHRAGHFNAARDNYLRALQQQPSHFAARFNLARLLLSAGVVQESLHHAQRLLEQDARDPRVRQLARDIQSQMALMEQADASAP